MPAMAASFAGERIVAASLIRSTKNMPLHFAPGGRSATCASTSTGAAKSGGWRRAMGGGSEVGVGALSAAAVAREATLTIVSVSTRGADGADGGEAGIGRGAAARTVDETGGTVKPAPAGSAK